MASGAWILFNSFRAWEGDGTFDLDTDADYKVCLLTAAWTPDVTKSLYSELTNELPTAGGYTSGGNAFTQSYVQNGASVTLGGTLPSFAASGATLAFRYAVLYKNSTSNGHVKPLIAYCDLETTLAAGANLSLTAGATGTLSNPNGVVRKQ